MVGEISNGKAFYKAIETNDPEKLNDELLKLENPRSLTIHNMLPLAQIKTLFVQPLKVSLKRINLKLM